MAAYEPLFVAIADGITKAGGFDEPERWRFDWERDYTRDEWLDQLPTFGGMTRLGPEQLSSVLAEVGSAVDALGGTITVRYATVVVTARRSG